MNQIQLPVSSLRSAYQQAARVYQAARGSSPTPQPARPNAAQETAAPQPKTPVELAIASAARQTSVDFDYLIEQAQVESSMNPSAQARTSSASGLYQFIESTWLGTMQRHGERFGLGNIADQISTSANGNAYVADPAARASILAMRNDPQIASFMAAGLAEDNRAHLTPILGRQPDHSELYLAHFLGAGGAGRFLTALEQNPSQRADALFSAPAAANRAVFYTSDGSARSLSGVMQYLSGKLENAKSAAGSVSDRDYIAGASPDFLPANNRSVSTISETCQPLRLGQLAAPQAPLTQPRPSMSSLLESSFTGLEGSTSSRSVEHVRRAYQQLKALGL